MGVKSRARSVAAVSCAVLIAIAYAGSDHPPPWGFLLLVLLLGAWSVLLAVLLQPLADLTRPDSRAWLILALGAGLGAATSGAILTVVRALLQPPLPAVAWVGVGVAGVLGGCAAMSAGAVTRVLARSSAGRSGGQHRHTDDASAH